MKQKQLGWLLPLACLCACGNGANHEQFANTDSTAVAAVAPIPSSITDTQRRIIRTADISLRVKNVVTAVDSLERRVTSVGGVVEESSITNNTGAVSSVYYTADSLKELHTYTTTARLTLRVPVARLDSVVRSIPSLATFIDSRNLKQTDVTADVLGNEALLKTGNKVYTAEKAVKLAKKTEDLVKVQEYEDANTIAQVSRKVENMQLMDQVRFSTLTVAISQPQQVYSCIVVNPDYVARVPLGLQLKQAFATSIETVGAFLVGLVNLLPFLLLVGLGVFSWLRWRRLNFRKRAASIS